jgi:hypothetical protein
MTTTPTPVPVPGSPAVAAATEADAIAIQLRDILTTLQTVVPALQKFDSKQIRRISASAKFGSKSVVQTINMVSAVPRAKDRKMFDVNAGQLALQYRDQLVPIAKQIASFAADLEFTADNMLAGAAVQALQTYQWARHASRQPDGADVRSYVDEMANVVKKTMNHRKPPAKTPQTPAPAPTVPHGAQGFLAPNLAQAAVNEPSDDIADRFDQALRDSAE